jgi:uncharacterized protein (TIGR02996 family)
VTAEAELLSRIIAEPEAIEPRRVYADLLTARGDPRGELIAVQCAAEELDEGDPRRWRLDERAGDLLAEHGAAWAPERERYLPWHPSPPRRGFVERASLDLRGHGFPDDTRDALAALRADTPLRRLGLTPMGAPLSMAALPEALTYEIELQYAMVDEVEPALRSGQHLDRLVGLYLAGAEIAAELLGALGRYPLERLTLNARRAPLAELGGVIRRLRKLCLLHVPIDAVVLAAGERLEELELSPEDRDGAMLHATSTPPRLRALDLRVAASRGLLAWLERLPALRSLRLAAADLGDRDCAALVGGPLGERLFDLRLDANAIGDAGLAALAAMPRLERLSLHADQLTAAGIEALAASPLAARIRTLYLYQMSDEAAGALASAPMPELRDLWADPLGEAPLAGMPRLRRLNGKPR